MPYRPRHEKPGPGGRRLHATGRGSCPEHQSALLTSQGADSSCLIPVCDERDSVRAAFKTRRDSWYGHDNKWQVEE